MNKNMLLVLLVSFVSCGINATEEVVTTNATETVAPTVRKPAAGAEQTPAQAEACTDCGCGNSN